ncbi:hypothetical protein An11g03030 [Aspergillus niger]|uniref:Uncharacterized protein n=2 Tax=Aspergillus niger TaxID=5061 RepID=A2QVY1_ASPNC|nr:hypothetical protein An11g03030 [Aspergillus niger]CAK40635.1 hypothetical protein An11g03030 [Aspergillus niger]
MTVYKCVLLILSLDQSERCQLTPFLLVKCCPVDIQIGSSIDKMMVAVEIWPDLKVFQTRDRVVPGVKVHRSAVVVFRDYMKRNHDKLRKGPADDHATEEISTLTGPAPAPKMGIKQRTGGKYPPCQCKPVGCR